jgi:pyruvate formate lyase activating enzyme
MTKAMIFDIQRYSLHDGPGIRTTVFLKGCPLRCMWCHNPESISNERELAFFEDRCTQCGTCVGVCPNQVHTIEEDQHLIDRSHCHFCGRCTEACLSNALEITGREMTVEEVLQTVLKDVSYYNTSEGGVTLSGGEPMQQFDFTLEFLGAAKAAGLHTCLDTSGLALMEHFEAVIPHVDLFLFDYKATSPAKHLQWTKGSNEQIIQNFEYIYEQGGRIDLRCPLVPGLNDGRDHLDRLKEIKKKYPGLHNISILPYHNTGRSKYSRYGIENALPEINTVSEKQMETWNSILYHN